MRKNLGKRDNVKLMQINLSIIYGTNQSTLENLYNVQGERSGEKIA